MGEETTRAAVKDLYASYVARDFARVAALLAGKIPELSLAKPTARQTAQAQSYDKCEALAEERGSVTDQNTHSHFIVSCMAGRVR